MENGGKMYGLTCRSDSSALAGPYCNVTTTAVPFLPCPWDTVGSGSGGYLTSPPRLDLANSSLSVDRHAGPAGSAVQADPHLTCLGLGKRHWRHFGDGVSAVAGVFSEGGKRGRCGYYRSRAAAVVARCQVQGCEVTLEGSKEYHKRHRVCEEHSKAPVVVVLGLPQRFCQQCSRFHVVSEFDESKRSCRRRLAGHNERRRKSSHDYVPRTRTSSQGGAYSLLSSTTETCGLFPSNLSLQCSAALRELIAEHRATILAHQLVLEGCMMDSGPSSSSVSSMRLHQVPHPVLPTLKSADESGQQVTLDLMQSPISAFGGLPMRGKQQQECYELWNSF
ncbi:squamosa promoter-binding-like protein 7 [Punica granatum]|uniref:SBP-type domain-containing protein n=2 Tax=Punica granatum TaxID=22663 RepID=A0A218X4J9_PUNGR|nr:squamosa promoter-binding-like protein 7 [Punica granatum]OWM80155.1 hypothetical protein CDL15_Pgr019319 [Punica granatum]PKI79516.1 hypothetical protein CRG98_000085 [Punica granatum]